MDENEQLTLKYIPLADAMLWDRNPKLHDLGLMAESFYQHGFKEPPRFEPTLNGSSGGIGSGNGRIKTLSWLKEQGREPPRGILVAEDGEWFVPMVFGVDAESQAAAEAFAVDANNLGLAGGNFSVVDVAGIWDGKGYLDLLEDLGHNSNLPTSVDGDDVDMLVDVLRTSPPDLDELTDKYGEPQEREFWPIIRVQVSPETHTLYRSLMSQAVAEDETGKFGQLMGAVDASVLGNELS